MHHWSPNPPAEQEAGRWFCEVPWLEFINSSCKLHPRNVFQADSSVKILILRWRCYSKISSYNHRSPQALFLRVASQHSRQNHKPVGALTMLLLKPHAPPHKPAGQNTVRTVAGTEISLTLHTRHSALCLYPQEGQTAKEHRLWRSVIYHPQRPLLWAFISMTHDFKYCILTGWLAHTVGIHANAPGQGESRNSPPYEATPWALHENILWILVRSSSREAHKAEWPNIYVTVFEAKENCEYLQFGSKQPLGGF